MNDQPVNVTDVVEEGVVEILQESPQNEGLNEDEIWCSSISSI